MFIGVRAQKRLSFRMRAHCAWARLNALNDFDFFSGCRTLRFLKGAGLEFRFAALSKGIAAELRLSLNQLVVLARPLSQRSKYRASRITQPATGTHRPARKSPNLFET